MPLKEEPDPVADALADALSDLAHPSGQRVWLTGLAGDKMRRARATTAEAITSWLRGRSKDQGRCILCGTGDGEVQSANQRAAEAWAAVKDSDGELRTAMRRVSELESSLSVKDPA